MQTMQSSPRRLAAAEPSAGSVPGLRVAGARAAAHGTRPPIRVSRGPLLPRFLAAGGVFVGAPFLFLGKPETFSFILSRNNWSSHAFLCVVYNPRLGKRCFQIERKQLWIRTRSDESASGGRSKPCARPGCCTSCSSRYGAWGERRRPWGPAHSSASPSQQRQRSVLRDPCGVCFLTVWTRGSFPLGRLPSVFMRICVS